MALIRRLGDLDPDSRATLGPVLHEKYHIPVITLIHSIEGSASGKLIRVQTVEGPDSLDINGETDVDFSGYPSVLFTDRTKRRKYVIEDAGNLDKQSRDLIRRHLRTPGRPDEADTSDKVKAGSLTRSGLLLGLYICHLVFLVFLVLARPE